MNILIIRLTSLGDIIHTYPMLYDIKSHFRNSQIDWLVDSEFSELVYRHPMISNVITIPLRKWAKNKLTLIPNVLKWSKTGLYKSKRYDYIIDAQGLLKSAILAKLFNGPVHGFSSNSIKEKLAVLFYNHTHAIGRNNLALIKSRLLAASILNYKINKSKVSFGLTLKERKENEDAPKYVIFFHGTSKESKTYALENWKIIAEFILANTNFNIILPFGSHREKSKSLQLQQLLDSARAVVPNERLSYGELINLIQNSEFVFGVDTGLVHLANALNQRVIAIYVNTNPQKTGIFESNRAKNVGGIGKLPEPRQIIGLFKNLVNE